MNEYIYILLIFEKIIKKNKKNKKKKMKQTEVSKKQESSKLSQSQNETKHITISKIPKNVNQYSHLIDCYYITGSDIEYMLALRHYVKLGPVSKDLSTNSPSFYDKDLEKYRKRIELTKDEKMKLKTNLAVFDHVIDHKAGQPANRSILDFETMLRKSEKGVIKKNINPNPWNSTSFPKTKNLFDPFLPPILEQSKNNLEKNKDKIARKLIQINTVRLIFFIYLVFYY